jgi:hypothetical protein
MADTPRAPTDVSSTPWRLPDVGRQRGVAGLEPGPDRVQRVGPEPVDVGVLPVVAADRHRGMPRSGQHRLDPGRSQLDPEGGATVADGLGQLGRHLVLHDVACQNPEARR